MAFSEALRYEVKRLAHLSCCVCKSTGIEVHHIVPRSEGGLDEIDNAAPLCPSCHETYGANPQKRKFIREARNIWYDICQARYSNESNRILQLQEDLKLFMSKIESNFFSESIANHLFKKLKESSFYFDIVRTGESMSIGEIIQYILSFKEPDEVSQKKNLDVCYHLLFKTTGDKTDYNIEYNILRNDFLKNFGELVAKKLTIHLMGQFNINWIEGVTENDLQRFMNSNFISMIILLHHKDLGPVEFSLNVTVTQDGELKASLAN